MKQIHWLAIAAFVLLTACPAAQKMVGTSTATSTDTGTSTNSQSDALPEAGFYNNATGSPLLKVLNGATSSLDIEIYQMADADVRAALRAALARGVKIRVVKEPAPIGDACDIFSPVTPKDKGACIDQKKLHDEILAKGGSYVPFNKEKLCADSTRPCFEHGKMVIADKKLVLVSTGNFNSSNLCNLAYSPAKCNRDYTMVERKPEIVSFLANVFEGDLATNSYDLQSLLFKGGPSDRVTVSPLSLEPLVALIRSATTLLRIENQYMKDSRLNEAVFEAAKRGVRVEMLVASLCSFGAPSEKDTMALKKLFDTYEQAGIAVKLLPAQFKINGRPGYLHAKAIVVDDRKAWVGSVNGSFAATSNNREFGIFFDEPSWVANLSAVMKADFESPDMESFSESLACKKDQVDSPAGSDEGDTGE